MSSTATPAAWWEEKSCWGNKQMEQQGSASAERVRICYKSTIRLLELILRNLVSILPI